MLFIGDVHIYVSDFPLALRFWADGLGLVIAEQQISRYSGYARLDFPGGGSSLRLLGPVATPDPAPAVPHGTYPTISFDITTTNFDDVLTRLIEYGGRQRDEVETYNGLRHVTIADPDGNTFELLEIGEPGQSDDA